MEKSKNVNTRRRVSIIFTSPSLTKQSFKNEANINNIISKYKKTGIMQVNSKQAMYGDFSNIKDYQEALNAVNDAKEAFQSLPSELRSRFNNDPKNLIEFLENPKNAQEAIKIGLFQEKGINIAENKNTPLETKASGVKTQSEANLTK